MQWVSNEQQQTSINKQIAQQIIPYFIKGKTWGSGNFPDISPITNTYTITYGTCNVSLVMNTLNISIDQRY